MNLDGVGIKRLPKNQIFIFVCGEAHTMEKSMLLLRGGGGTTLVFIFLKNAEIFIK